MEWYVALLQTPTTGEVWALVLLSLAIYFLPTIISWRKQNNGAIFALNLLLGWTVIGWIAALVWALTKDQPQPQAAGNPPSDSKASQRPVMTILILVGVFFLAVTLLDILSSGRRANQPGAQVTTSETSAPAWPPPVTVTPSTPQLALLSSRGYGAGGGSEYYVVAGQVRNLSNAPIKNVEAVATWYTKEGTFIASDSALIKYNPLMPLQVSPFEVICRGNPMMAKYTIEFKTLFGGSIDTLDQRRH